MPEKHFICVIILHKITILLNQELTCKKMPEATLHVKLQANIHFSGFSNFETITNILLCLVSLLVNCRENKKNYDAI